MARKASEQPELALEAPSKSQEPQGNADIIIDNYRFVPLPPVSPSKLGIACEHCGYGCCRLRITDSEWVPWCRRCGNFTGHIRKKS